MSNEWNEWNKLILQEMKRFDSTHRDLMGEIGKIRDEQIDQGKTLVRNTLTVEQHVIGSIASNKRLMIVEDKLEVLDGSIKEEIRTLNIHISKIDRVIKFLTPTRAKIKWVLVIVSTLGGSYGGYQLTDEKNMEAILKILEQVLR